MRVLFRIRGNNLHECAMLDDLEGLQAILNKVRLYYLFSCWLAFLQLPFFRYIQGGC